MRRKTVITKKGWVGVVKLITGLLVAIAPCVCKTAFLKPHLDFEKQDLIENGARITAKESAMAATFKGYSPDRLPADLGTFFPALKKLDCICEEPAPEGPPSEEQTRNVVPFKKVEILRLFSFSISPYTLDWARAWYPNVSNLTLTIDDLPIRSTDNAETGHRKTAVMDNVTELTIESYGMEPDEVPPLLENLQFFPKIESLACDEFIAGETLKRLMRNEGKREVPSLKRLKLHRTRVDPDFLSEIMGIFPKLEELCVSRNTFVDLMTHFSKDSSPFKSLRKLGVTYSTESGMPFTAKIADLFPSVREIQVLEIPSTMLPSTSAPIDAIKAVTIVGGGEPSYPLSSLGCVFPNMDSLNTSDCEFQNLLGCTLDDDTKFFAGLKHLNISNNRHLQNIAEKMEPFREHFQIRTHSLPNPSKFSQEMAKVANASTNMMFKPLAPILETLVIRKTFKFTDAPCWLFQAFPNITRLEVSNEMFEGSTANIIFELFKPLTRLEQLDVAFESACSLPEQSAVEEILAKLKPLRSCFAIRFFAEHPSPKIATELKYLACEMEH